MKYRKYDFETDKVGIVHLKEVKLADKLPETARKFKNSVSKSHDIWITTEKDGKWSKLCRAKSDIDFGTGLTAPQ